MGFEVCIALTILVFFQYDRTILTFALWRKLSLCSTAAFICNVCENSSDYLKYNLFQKLVRIIGDMAGGIKQKYSASVKIFT